MEKAVLMAINISPERGTPKQRVQNGTELITDWGVKGDAHAGTWHRQVSLLSFEKIEDFKKRGAEVEDGAFGENLIVSGIDLKALPLGTRLKIGESLLEISQIGKECHTHCAIFKRMGECIMPVEGVFAVVLKGGYICPGDTVEVMPATLYGSLYDRLTRENKRSKDAACIATVIEGPAAGEKCLFIDEHVRVHREVPGQAVVLNEKLLPTLLATKKPGVVAVGDNKVFMLPYGSRSRLVICGGGHVAIQTARLAKMLHWEVWMLEDRIGYKDSRTDECVDVYLNGSFTDNLKKVTSDTDNYYVCATRGHQYDMECMVEILRKEFAYVGALGSKRRAVLVRKELEEAGISADKIEELHMPVGLAIGAETPEEIAVSIMGEILKIKAENSQGVPVDRSVLQQLGCGKLSTESEKDLGRQSVEDRVNQQSVLCTIVEKQGSTPRSVGTQMLVCEDSFIGTIGGGIAEASIMAAARDMLKESQTNSAISKLQIMEVEMTMDEAKEEGMVCGGRIRVLLEVES